MEIQYIKQPTEYLCGQACVAMLTNVFVDDVIEVIQNDKGIGKKDLARALEHFGLPCAKIMTKIDKKTPLPDTCTLKVLLPNMVIGFYTIMAGIMIRNSGCWMDCTRRNGYNYIGKFLFDVWIVQGEFLW